MTLIFCMLFANCASATFSIVAYDPDTGDLGVAVASKFLAVGSVVPWAKAGVGAVATQARANVTYGPEGLRRMANGEAPDAIITSLTAADPLRDQRQVGMIDAKGNTAAYTGTSCYAWAGHKTGTHFTVQGNILTGEDVLKAMAAAFTKARESGKGELADWMLAAMRAGDKAGGDRRGKQSAAILVVRDKGGYDRGNDRYIDFRVDDHADPLPELLRLLKLRYR
jgi:uncharacterized Ntn-hydrolase superfamily protein